MANSALTEPDRLLLWVAQTEGGLMTDDLICPKVVRAAERMEADGLLVRGEPVGNIQVFYLSAAGVAAMGGTVQ